jgi:cytoskeletal protein CcmA (bactofilin family)
MAKSNENYLASVNLVSGTTQIKGDIETGSDIRIDGELHGNLTTKGRLIIGEQGKVYGDVRCQTAEIEGVLKGKIFNESLLALKSTAVFEGEIETAQLQIEAGAKFSGSCKMNQTNKQN